MILQENWDCADAPGVLTCQLTWSQIGPGLWGILSNSANMGLDISANNNIGRADTDLDTPNHMVEAVLRQYTTGAGFLSIGVIARKDATSTQTFYLVSVDNGNLHLYRCVNGAFTQLDGGGLGAAITGDALRLSCQGSLIQCYLNGALKFSISDSVIPTGLRCGIYGVNDTSGQIGRLDNWTAVDLPPLQSMGQIALT